jgi:hypothetical protein
MSSYAVICKLQASDVSCSIICDICSGKVLFQARLIAGCEESYIPKCNLIV